MRLISVILSALWLIPVIPGWFEFSLYVRKCTNVQLFRIGIDGSLTATSTVQDQVIASGSGIFIEELLTATLGRAIGDIDVCISDVGISGNFAYCLGISSRQW